MKISYFGLSCFLVENREGFRILVDPFNDAPEWSLGPRFPAEFRGQPFGANIVLMSEPDADHAYAPGDWLQNAPQTKPNQDVFPGLDLRGTVVHEFNGDLNIAWHYTVDGIRCLHLADNAHDLTVQQLKEFGQVDVAFVSAPKADSEAALAVTRRMVVALKPKIVIWAHHLVPEGMPDIAATARLHDFFRGYFESHAKTNKNYSGPEGLMPLCFATENANRLNAEMGGMTLEKPEMEIDADILTKGAGKPLSIFFRTMLAKSR
jgi:L-ascorbate metabolism protein UlaG (beta-lactamase superfamily)